MNRPEKLRRARRTYTVAWRKFLNQANDCPNTLFCFFEGEDHRYFIGRIEPYLAGDSDVKPLDCGGKGGVIKVNDLWFKKHSNEPGLPKCLFFLDRDFDHRGALKLHSPTYITPAYSIENLYVTNSCAQKLLETEFKVSGEEELEKCDALSFFESMLEQFLDAANELNAWIFLQRKYELIENAGYKCHLKSVPYSKLFKVSRNGVVKKYTRETLPTLFPDARPIDDSELERYENWLASTDRRKIFRGKYLIDFLRDVLLILKEDRCTKEPTLFEQKGKVTLGLSTGNLISEVSQYATTPECLKEFLVNELSKASLCGPHMPVAKIDQQTA